MKRILSLFVPEAPILVAAALLATLPSLRAAAVGLVAFYPYTVLAAALLSPVSAFAQPAQNQPAPPPAEARRIARLLGKSTP